MHNEPNSRFQFELCRMSGSGDAQFSFTITDRASDLTVLEARLSAEQFADLLSGRINSKGIPVWFLPAERRMEVGQHRAVISRRFSYDAAVNEETVMRWATEVRGFVIPIEHAPEVHRKGGNLRGFEVSFTKVFPSEEEAAVWQVTAQRLLDGLPTPAELPDLRAIVSEG